MEVDEFIVELEALFELESGALSIDSIVEDSPNWSSLAFLRLIAMIDDHFQIALTPRQIHGCSTVGDLHSLVEKMNGLATVG